MSELTSVAVSWTIEQSVRFLPKPHSQKSRLWKGHSDWEVNKHDEDEEEEAKSADSRLVPQEEDEAPAEVDVDGVERISCEHKHPFK